MAANYIQLSIPEPCHEGWNNMVPVDEQRAHCNSCKRVLTDFSQMSDTELALWFVQNKGKLCGHFSKSQLDRPIAIPADKPVRKNWLHALWLLPLSLFAKPGHAQTISGKPPVCVNDGSQVAQQKQAQDTTTVVSAITGVVKSRDELKPVAGAKVSLLHRTINAATGEQQLQPVASTTTNEKGEYTLTLPKDFDKSNDTRYIEALKDDYIRSMVPLPVAETPKAVYLFLRHPYEIMDGVVHMAPPKKTK